MSALYDLLELAREHEFDPEGSEGKTCFQVARQFERPSEFLQVALDMVRVCFDPEPPGTFFLNSNMSFLYEGIPDEPFQFAYASALSEPGQDFAGFWSGAVALHLAKCGYDLKNAAALYAAVTTGKERYGTEFVCEVSGVLNSGFSAPQAFELLASGKAEKTVHAGFCLDAALGERVRLSLWFFCPSNKQSLH